MDVTPRPVGITGSSGFIGGHLVRACAAAGISTVLFQGDITKPDDVGLFFEKHQPDRIIHLAGVHSGTRKAFNGVNAIGTKNILRAAVSHRHPYILFASSAAVYGNVTKPAGAKESDPVRPNTPYGESKAAAEAHIRATVSDSTVRAAILRLGSVYGPGQTKGIIPVLTDSIRRSHVAEYDETHPVIRQFIHVSDVCRIILALLAQSFEGIVNVASDDVYDIAKLADILARSYTFRRVNRPVQTDYTDMRMNITKLRTRLGFQPAHSLASFLLQ